LDTILLRGPSEGDYFLRLKTETGATGLYRYFSYNPGDTLEYSFSYMIPTGQYNSNDPGFNLGIGLTATDADANFMEYEEVYYTINNDDPNYRLYADNEWHDINISFSNSSLAAVGNYFQVFINEWSHFNPWVYDSARTMTAYYDDFKVEVKKSKNSKPSDFSILHPVSGDAFNLDTIVNFQTIPFSWEPSVDPDTVSYTNRLVCKVVCDGALISKGFESFSMNEVWDPVLEQQITRKMPQGYDGNTYNLAGTGGANTVTVAVTNNQAASSTDTLAVSVTGSIDNTSLTTAQLASHGHGLPLNGSYSPTVTWGWTGGGNKNISPSGTSYSSGSGTGHNHSHTLSGTLTGNITTSLTGAVTASGTNAFSPYVVVNYIIKH